MEKEYKVFMPNRGFCGFRNGLKERSIPFKDGVSQIALTEREAEIFVKNYGYFCPELTGEMLPWEIEEAETGDGSPETGEEKEADSGERIAESVEKKEPELGTEPKPEPEPEPEPELEPEPEPEPHMEYVENKKDKRNKKSKK